MGQISQGIFGRDFAYSVILCEDSVFDSYPCSICMPIERLFNRPMLDSCFFTRLERGPSGPVAQ